MNVKEKVLEVLCNMCESSSIKEKIQDNTDLQDIGLDSIMFMQLIVELEEYYNIEFDEELLGMDELRIFSVLIEKIERYLA